MILKLGRILGLSRQPTSGLRPRPRPSEEHAHHRRKRRWLSSEPCHEARRGDNATTLRRAQLPNEPTSRRADDAVAHCVLSNAVPSNAAPSNAAPSNERRAVERADHCAVLVGGGASHTLCRRTLRRRTGTLRRRCRTLCAVERCAVERVERCAIPRVWSANASRWGQWIKS